MAEMGFEVDEMADDDDEMAALERELMGGGDGK